MAWKLYFHLADHAGTLEHVAVYNSGGGTLTGGGSPAAPNHTRDTLACLGPRRPASTRPVVHRTGRRDWRCARRGLVPWSVGADSAAIAALSAARSFSTVCQQKWSASCLPRSVSRTRARTCGGRRSPTRANASFLFTLAGVARLQTGATTESARTEITSLIEDLSRIVPNQRGLISQPSRCRNRWSDELREHSGR